MCMCMCTRTYTYAYTYTYTLTPAQALTLTSPTDILYLMSVGLGVRSGLLAWCERAHRSKRTLRDGLRRMFTIETSDDSGSKLRDKEQQRLSSK